MERAPERARQRQRHREALSETPGLVDGTWPSHYFGVEAPDGLQASIGQTGKLRPRVAAGCLHSLWPRPEGAAAHPELPGWPATSVGRTDAPLMAHSQPITSPLWPVKNSWWRTTVPSERGLRALAAAMCRPQPGSALIVATLRVQRRRSGELERLDQISGEQAFLSFPRAPAGLCTHGRGKRPGGGVGWGGVGPPRGSAERREVPSAPHNGPLGEGVGKPPPLFQLHESIGVGLVLLLPLNVSGSFSSDAVQTWSFLCGKVFNRDTDFSHRCMADRVIYFFLSELWEFVSFKELVCVI